MSCTLRLANWAEERCEGGAWQTLGLRRLFGQTVDWGCFLIWKCVRLGLWLKLNSTLFDNTYERARFLTSMDRSHINPMAHRCYWSHISGANLTSSQWHTVGNQVRFSERCNTNMYNSLANCYYRISKSIMLQMYIQEQLPMATTAVVTTYKAMQATVRARRHRRHEHWTQTRSQRGLNEVQTRSREWLGQGWPIIKDILFINTCNWHLYLRCAYAMSD